jgi:hypothetical protein
LKRDVLGSSLDPSDTDVEARWAALLRSDATGVDGDIETLVGRYQTEHGCTRNEAHAALVRALLSLDEGFDVRVG